MQLVRVVRDVHLLLAHQLPVVAVDRAVEHVELIRGAHAVRGRPRIVVGDVGSAPDPALTRVVEPGAAVLLDLVQGLVHQQDAAGKPRRGGDLLLEHEDLVVEIRLGHSLDAVEQVELVIELHQGVLAAAGGSRLGGGSRGDAAPEAQQVVPDNLHTLLRNRKGDAVDGSGDTVAVLHQFGSSCDLLGLIVDTLWIGGTAVRRIDVHLEARIGLEHGLVARSELIGVLRHVLGRDGEHHRVGTERIGVMHPRLVPCRRFRDATVPRRDGAVGVTGFLRTQGSQIGPEPRDLLRRQLCLDLGRPDEKDCQSKTEEDQLVSMHNHVLLPLEGVLDVDSYEVAVVDEVIASGTHVRRPTEVELPLGQVVQSETQRQCLTSRKKGTSRTRGDAADIMSPAEAWLQVHGTDGVVVGQATHQTIPP